VSKHGDTRLLQDRSFYRARVDLKKSRQYNPEYEAGTLTASAYAGGTHMAETEIGKVSEFFAKPVVAGIDLTAGLKIGDKIHIKGHTTDMEMTIASMQVDNKSVAEAKKGQAVGIKVPDRARQGDTVYKVT
jgi:translation initiation factor IF-2